MIAVDTNVVLRIIVGDDEEQVRAVLEILSRETIFVSLTVLLETEWVLRSRYKYSRSETGAAFTALMKLDGVVIDRASDVEWVLERHASGGDFADLVHVMGASEARAFATFDRNLSKRAGKSTPVPVETLA